ncbi:MAG: hypothetical protein P8Y05_11550, partial [Deinococcales bacterium]
MICGARARAASAFARQAGAARHRWHLALASGALLVVAGRPWGLGWLALVAFVPLLAALRLEPSALRAAVLVAVPAFGAAFVVYEALGPFAPALLPPVAAAAALPFAAVGALAARLRRALGEDAVVASFPVLWLAAECLPGRSWLLGRFATPLFAVGYSQAGLPAMQLARLGGVAAVSLAVLACNALLTLALLRRGRWAVPALFALTLLVAGVWRSAPAPAGGSGAVRGAAPTRAQLLAQPRAHLRIVQRALPDAAYAAAAAIPAARTALLQGYVDQTRAGQTLTGQTLTAQPVTAAHPSGPGFTLWPEGALPGPLPATGPTGLEPMLGGLGPVLAGAPARTPEGIANAAYAWEGGTLRRVYLKRRLAPITEAGLVAGTNASPLELGGVRVAPLICFEAAFPELAR